MKLKFAKGEDGAIAVNFSDELGEKDFNYVEMIQYLYTRNNFEEPEFSKGVDENEQIKIKEMIEKMNQMIVLREEHSV